MYHIKLPKDMMADLWRLREYYGKGTIIDQVREAVYRYLHEEKEKLGYSVSEFRDDEREDGR